MGVSENLAEKLDAFMEQMMARQQALIKHMADISIVLRGMEKKPMETTADEHDGNSSAGGWDENSSAGTGVREGNSTVGEPKQEAFPQKSPNFYPDEISRSLLSTYSSLEPPSSGLALLLEQC